MKAALSIALLPPHSSSLSYRAAFRRRGYYHADDPANLVRDLAARSASWLAPPGSLETLEYDFISGSEVTRIRARRGEPRRVAVWMGATLHAGFHELTRSPERFAVELKREPGAKTLTLVAKLKDEKGNLHVEAGNGVENSWRGYFSQGPGRPRSSWTRSGSCRSRSRPVGRRCATPTGRKSAAANGSPGGSTC